MFAQRPNPWVCSVDIIPVVEPFLDDDAHEAKRQGSVGAGLDGDMPVGDPGGPCPVGVDHYQPSAVSTCFFNKGPKMNIVPVDIRTPTR